MAEGMLRAMLEREGASGVSVGSAGTAGIEGMPATAPAVAVTAEHGIDLSGHVSRALTRELAEASDLILAMTRGHEQDILATAPSVEGRVFLLSEFAGVGDADVPDPIGGPEEEYREVYGMLDEMLEAAVPRIVKAAEEKRG